MGKLILKGDTKVLQQIAKSIRLKAKRNNIEVSLKQEKSAPKEVKETKEDNKTKHWQSVIADIKKVETLEDLKPFEADERKAVIKAVAEKKLELETI